MVAGITKCPYGTGGSSIEIITTMYGAPSRISSNSTWVVINVIHVSTSRVYGTLIDVYQRHPTIANANPPHSTLSRPTPSPPRFAGVGAGASAYLMDADRRRVCTGR